MAAPLARAAAMARAISAGEANGRAASCTSTSCGSCGCKASRPARTEACRVAPPGTGGNRRNPALAARNSAASSGWMTGCTRAIPAWLANAARLGRMTGSPADLPVLLGQVAAGAQPAAGCHDDGCDTRSHVHSTLEDDGEPWL